MFLTASGASACGIVTPETIVRKNTLVSSLCEPLVPARPRQRTGGESPPRAGRSMAADALEAGVLAGRPTAATSSDRPPTRDLIGSWRPGSGARPEAPRVRGEARQSPPRRRCSPSPRERPSLSR